MSNFIIFGVYIKSPNYTEYVIKVGFHRSRLISCPNEMVLFEHPKHMFKLIDKKIIKNFVYLDQCLL